MGGPGVHRKIGRLQTLRADALHNRATSGAFNNAIDHLYSEWDNKAAGLWLRQCAGGESGENLRLVMGELQVADVRRRSGFRSSPTSRTSASSSPIPSKRSPSTPYFTKSLLGAAR